MCYTVEEMMILRQKTPLKAPVTIYNKHIIITYVHQAIILNTYNTHVYLMYTISLNNNNMFSEISIERHPKSALINYATVWQNMCLFDMTTKHTLLYKY